MKKSVLTIANTITKSGKNAVYIRTKNRLSVEDFKALMADIRTAEGFGYLSYIPDFGRCITAVKIDAETLQSLARQYKWMPKEEKPKKAEKPAKMSAVVAQVQTAEAKKKAESEAKAVAKAEKAKAKREARFQALQDAIVSGEFTPTQLAEYRTFLKAMKEGTI